MNADARSAPNTTGRLEATLRAGEFAMVCEISPPRGASIQPLQRKARLVRDWVDAAVITDGQGAQTRMAGWAGCLAVKAEGVEPVMLLQGRDRNRIALQADLLGAAGMGIDNIVVQSGDRATHGDHPQANEAFDLDSLGLIQAASTMKQRRQLISGRTLSMAPNWFIGGVENATMDERKRIDRLVAKVDAGMQFVLLQYVFDLKRFEGWMQRVRDLGLDQRVFILAGVGPVMSGSALSFLESLGDVYLPETVTRRLRGLSEDQVAKEGMALAVETLQVLRETPGVAGAYLLTSNREEVVEELLTHAGVRAAKSKEGTA